MLSTLEKSYCCQNAFALGCLCCQCIKSTQHALCISKMHVALQVGITVSSIPPSCMLPFRKFSLFIVGWLLYTVGWVPPFLSKDWGNLILNSTVSCSIPLSTALLHAIFNLSLQIWMKHTAAQLSSPANHC